MPRTTAHRLTKTATPNVAQRHSGLKVLNILDISSFLYGQTRTAGYSSLDRRRT